MKEHNTHLSFFDTYRLIFVGFVHDHLDFKIQVFQSISADWNIDWKMLHCVN